MAQPAKKAKTSPNLNAVLHTFGESMIRFSPLDETTPATATRAEPQSFLRSVGGDELNVAVALSKLGERTRSEDPRILYFVGASRPSAAIMVSRLLLAL